MIYTQLCIIHTLSLSPVLSYEHCGIHLLDDFGTSSVQLPSHFPDQYMKSTADAYEPGQI